MDLEQTLADKPDPDKLTKRHRYWVRDSLPTNAILNHERN
jgi:hypothetical protein